MNREVNKFVGYQEELAVPISDHGTLVNKGRTFKWIPGINRKVFLWAVDEGCSVQLKLECTGTKTKNVKLITCRLNGEPFNDDF